MKKAEFKTKVTIRLWIKDVVDVNDNRRMGKLCQKFHLCVNFPFNVSRLLLNCLYLFAGILAWNAEKQIQEGTETSCRYECN